MLHFYAFSCIDFKSFFRLHSITHKFGLFVLVVFFSKIVVYMFSFKILKNFSYQFHKVFKVQTLVLQLCNKVCLLIVSFDLVTIHHEIIPI